MRFTKMHGAGNDYVYVDLWEERVAEADAPALARAVSDRHRGVGADGLILLAPPSADGTDGADGADVRMVMYNADGSRAQMCGNGLRCLARLAVARGRAAGDRVAVQTDAGVLAVELRPGGARAAMGVPVLDPARIPVRLDGARVVDRAIEVDGRSFPMTCVSMGNPHAVLFLDAEPDAREVERYGRALETDPRFPERTNVEFVTVLDRGRVRQRTWERGSGETQACGTGACAVCVAGVLTGRTDGALTVSLLGGELELEWDGEGEVFMAGPAVEVFTGEWPGRGA